MFELSLSINWLAVLLASVALAALGATWFMALFPTPYATALGRTDLAGQKPKPLFIAGPFVCSVVLNLTNAVMLRSFGITSLSSALLFGAITGVGYLASTTINVAINPNIPRPLLYEAVNAPFFLVSNLISCAILAAMQ
ncbi:MAG: DUF1761 domain-containing protein [Archangiaceae bacterium]|nr:DUF1761 domain-containing protein [Archangiaceae bacterium]